MKAKIKIIAMLMTMIIGTLAASAQSAQRGTPQNKDQRKPSSTVTTKSNQNQIQARQVASKNENANPRSVAQKPPVSRSTVQQSNPEKQQAQRVITSRQTSQKVSTTTTHNPRSNYREADRTVQVNKTYLDPKQRSDNGSNYSGNHGHATPSNNNNNKYNNPRSHYYYPQKSVKIHVHPSTYHNHYKVNYYPAHREIIWTRQMHNYYIGIYPGYAWRYPVGYRVQTISAFEARYNIGEVTRVYGRVYGTWLNRDTDDLLLFFGGEFPNQEFTMVVPASIARRFSWNPERYFLGQHVMSTGLITTFDGSPEMVVKRRNQLEVF